MLNDNLTEQLAIIYNKWFENFESPFASSERIISEIGEIPNGWIVAEIGDYLESYSIIQRDTGRYFVEPHFNEYGFIVQLDETVKSDYKTKPDKYYLLNLK